VPAGGWAVSFRGGQRVARTARGRAPRKIIKIIWPRGGGSQLGWKTCVTSSPEEIAGKSVCHERTTAVAERPALGLLEPSSIPDGGKRRKINEATRQESTVEIIILMLRKEGGMPSTSSLKFRAFGIPPSWFPLGLCARLYVRNIVSDARVCRQCFSLS